MKRIASFRRNKVNRLFHHFINQHIHIFAGPGGKTDMRPFRGNPLAVVTIPADSPKPSQEQKQAVAREFNLSETVFVHDVADHDIKQREIDEDKAAMAEYGSSDSGASLGDILGAALQKKGGKKDE